MLDGVDRVGDAHGRRAVRHEHDGLARALLVQRFQDDRLVQAVEHEGRQRARLRAESHPRIARAAGRDERDDHADADVSRECQKAEQRVIMPDEQTHDEREQRRDGRGRDRVRVEDLEQLNVRRDDGDEVAAVAAPLPL